MYCCWSGPAILIAVLAGGGESAPVDLQRVVRIAQGDRRRVAVGVGLVALADPAGAHHGVEFAANSQSRVGINTTETVRQGRCQKPAFGGRVERRL